MILKTVKALRALGPIDVKNVSRDPLLRWMIFFPLLIAALMRWGVPFISIRVMEDFGFDLVTYYPLVMGFVILMMPYIAGVVIGFLLLDQRDDHTLTALQVTPLTLNSYLVYRVAMPILLSVVTTLFVFLIADLVEIDLVPLLIAELGAAPVAPLFALFLAAFASNKVEGFALMKASGVFLLPPLIAYFVGSGWQLAFGIAPLYWPLKLFWTLQAGEANSWLYLFIGLVYQFLLLSLLLRRFNKVMH